MVIQRDVVAAGRAQMSAIVPLHFGSDDFKCQRPGEWGRRPNPQRPA